VSRRAREWIVVFLGEKHGSGRERKASESAGDLAIRASEGHSPGPHGWTPDQEARTACAEMVRARNYFWARS